MAGKEEHKMFDYEEELDGYLEKIQELLKTKQYAAEIGRAHV